VPKVSVIIPTHNRAEFLYSAITSVLDQTYQDVEIIVVDDASEDNTRRVIDHFHDNRIKYFCHEKNKGEAGARNTGILNSKGEFIAFLDDDDEWLPEKLSLQVSLLDNNPKKFGLVYTGYFVIDKNSKNILSQRVPSKKGDVYNYIILKNIIGAPSTVLLRRECIEEVGLFDENIAYGLDHDMWIRISKYFFFEYVKESLVKYYIHHDRLSNNPVIRARGLDDMVKKYGKHIVLKNTYYRQSLLSIGVQFCHLGDMKNGIKLLIRAIRANSFELRNYFYLGCALFGARNFRRFVKFKDRLLAPLRNNKT